MLRELRYCTAFCALLLAALGSAWAQPARTATSFSFATVDEGRAFVVARDEYVRRLSPIERALKAKSEAPVSEAGFLQLLASAVRPWSDADRISVQQALESIRPQLVELKLPLPETVVLVRTSGEGEGNAPHTRANAIMLTDGLIAQPNTLAHVMAHELFHIASRQDKGWRDTMYATIGFVSIEEVALPQQLAARVITNPDAPRIDVAINVQTDGGVVWVAPLLQATADKYDSARGGEFFAYLKLVWLEISRDERAPQRAQLPRPPRLFDIKDLRGFHEQVGRNTAYIIHPEEILAENFAQLATRQAGRSPEVHQRLREALQSKR